MKCPYCHSENIEFVEVENPGRWVNNIDPNIVQFGTAIECQGCGLRGSGAFGGNNDSDCELAWEIWSELVVVDENKRQALREKFKMAPTLSVDRILDALMEK
jgi:hypothetical protein